MSKISDLTREALDFLGVTFHELPGVPFRRFITEAVVFYKGLSFLIVISERRGIVKVVAYSPDLRADAASDPFKGKFAPSIGESERRVMDGLLVGFNTLRNPETVAAVVEGIDHAATVLLGNDASAIKGDPQARLSSIRDVPGAAPSEPSENCGDPSAPSYNSFEK